MAPQESSHLLIGPRARSSGFNIELVTRRESNGVYAGLLMSVTEAVILFFAAFFAGTMNALAGGGTVLTFPALIFFGMPAIQANATSTLALMIGIVGSVTGYRQQIAAVRGLILRFAVVSVVGGLAGAALLTVTREGVFSLLVPWLLLFATACFLGHSAIRRFIGSSGKPAAEIAAGSGLWMAIGFQFFVAVYGGYFGAGIGILMLAALGLMGMGNIHEMNALKTVLAALINLVATLYFVAAGLIVWPQAIVMTAGATVGYFASSTVAVRIPQAVVRWIAAGIGIGISAFMFWQQFAAK